MIFFSAGGIFAHRDDCNIIVVVLENFEPVLQRRSRQEDIVVMLRDAKIYCTKFTPDFWVRIA